MERFDVIVAGLGAMGSAALDHLSRRGVRVLGIEPGGVPHAGGSSGGDSRLIRKAYFEHPDYVPLLERSYDNWRSLESDTGESLLHTVGALYLGRPDSDLIAGSRRSAEAHGLALETVETDDLGSDYPAFRCPEGYVALFEQEAGFVLSERAVRAQASRALANGAELVVGERVVSWDGDGRRVQVITERNRYEAGAMVVAAGAWSARLLPGLGLHLDVTRQPLFWLQPTSADFDFGRCPCWAVQRPDRPGLFHGVPALPGAMAAHLGVKLGHHAPGEPADPDGPRRVARHAELEAWREALAPFLPGLGGPVTASQVCLYTSSRDGHFLLDTHPGHPNVAFACGFSGHGFKFAPVMGEALADLVLERRSALPIGFLGLR